MRGSFSISQRLEGLQVLRAVAATLVVLFHAGEVWREKVGAELFSGPWDRGWAGVDLFFVLSGFIMVWVTQSEKDLGPKAAVKFGWKRLTRIYPIWWVFCALMSAYFFVTYGQPAPPGDAPWFRFWQSMALWPQASLPLLTVGWTLTFEIGFYGIFAALLLVRPQVRVGLLLVWGAIILSVWGSGNAPAAWPDRWSGIFLNPICLEFIFGATAGYLLLWAHIPQPFSRLCLLIGTLTFGFGLIAESGSAQEAGLLADYSRILQFGIPAALIVFGLAGEERGRDRSLPKGFVALGNASYSLYLLHLPLLLALIRLIGWGIDIPPSGLSFALFVGVGTALCLMVSLWVHRLIERPLIRLSRFPLVKVKSGRHT